MTSITVSAIPWAAFEEINITLPAPNIPRSVGVLDRALRERRARLATLYAFGGRKHFTELAAAAASRGWAAAFLDHPSAPPDAAPCLLATAVSGVEPRPVCCDGRPVGLVWEDSAGTYCRLCGLAPADRTESRERQAHSVFERMKHLLGQHNLAFTDMVHTWFYLDTILEWYGAFNAVRTSFYEQQDIFEHLLPASTGIGACNPQGTALIAGLFAVRPRGPQMRVTTVASPLQCSAQNYRSSFSRAVEIKTAAGRWLSISGTASIDPQGNSLHRDDTGRQIDHTLDVVASLMASRGMDWRHVTRGIAYFPDPEDRAQLACRCRARSYPPTPLALAPADICRDELRFEIELDAHSRNAAPGGDPPQRSR